MSEEKPSLAKLLQYLSAAPQSFTLTFNPHKSFEGDYPSVEEVDGQFPDGWISEEQRQTAIRENRYVMASVMATVPGEGLTVLGSNMEDVVYACALHCSRELERQKQDNAEFDARAKTEHPSTEA